MILRRFDSMSVLGIEIHRNVEIKSLMPALITALGNRPAIAPYFTAVVQTLNGLLSLDTTIKEQMSLIVALKEQLSVAKRNIETATKLYSIGATTSTGLIDAKPAVNGSPPATGALGVLNPLKAAIESGTELMQELEDSIKDAMEELNELTDTYRDQYNLAMNSLMDQISDLGNVNINI